MCCISYEEELKVPAISDSEHNRVRRMWSGCARRDFICHFFKKSGTFIEYVLIKNTIFICKTAENET
jgi:hypothetical protein